MVYLYKILKPSRHGDSWQSQLHSDIWNVERVFGWTTVLLFKFSTFLNLWSLSILKLELIGNRLSSLTLRDAEEVSQSSWGHKLKAPNGCMSGPQGSIQMRAGRLQLTSSFVISVDSAKIIALLHDICKSEAEAYLECSMWEALSISVYCVISVQKGKVHCSLRF